MGIQLWRKKKGGVLGGFLNKNKKKVLIVGLSILALIVVLILALTLKKGAERKVEEQKQRVEEARQTRMSAASWSRVSFFETLPINVSFAMPDYLEGNYRLVKGPSQATFLYIKDSSNPSEMLYIKVFHNEEHQLGEGEKDLPSDCQGYDFVYRLAANDSYSGNDQAGFEQALYDIKYFLENDGYFECRSRE